MTITLTAGMRSNLIALQSTNKLMESTQTRLSTGMKVNTALDDPVNFFKAKGHRDRASDLSALKDGMGEAIKTIEAANTGIEGIYDLLDQMKSLAQAARTSSNTTALKVTYDDLVSQVNSMAADADYGGNNLLDNDELTVAFSEDGTSTISVTGFSATTASEVNGITIAVAAFTASGITEAISALDAAVDSLRVEAQSLASNLSTIEIRADFTNEMINTLETGADTLTLADMNEEGANMLMLQTRQSLGTTSLSLASQAAQSVLRLF